MKKATNSTMRELAAALGVSTATVSMSLHNHPSIPLETRKRVQDFAQKNGYHLNPFLSSLLSRVRASQSPDYRATVGWLNLWETADHFTNAKAAEYHLALWAGATQRANLLGYHLDSFWLAEPGMTGHRLTNILKARGVRGLLIPPLPKPESLSIDWSQFSTVALSFTLASPLLHRAVPDHHGNMRLILSTIQRRKYKRPGLLLPELFDERCEDRCQSAFYFFQQGLPVEDRIPVLNTSDERFRRNATEWLGEYRPDVVITTGGFRELRTFDVGDPEYSRALGIVLLGHAKTDTAYSAIYENPLAIGAAGIDLLSVQLNNNELGVPRFPHSVLIKGDWMEGNTLPPLRRRAARRIGSLS